MRWKNFCYSNYYKRIHFVLHFLSFLSSFINVLIISVANPKMFKNPEDIILQSTRIICALNLIFILIFLVIHAIKKPLWVIDKYYETPWYLIESFAFLSLAAFLVTCAITSFIFGARLGDQLLIAISVFSVTSSTASLLLACFTAIWHGMELDPIDHEAGTLSVIIKKCSTCNGFANNQVDIQGTY